MKILKSVVSAIARLLITLSRSENSDCPLKGVKTQTKNKTRVFLYRLDIEIEKEINCNIFILRLFLNHVIIKRSNLGNKIY